MLVTKGVRWTQLEHCHNDSHTLQNVSYILKNVSHKVLVPMLATPSKNARQTLCKCLVPVLVTPSKNVRLAFQVRKVIGEWCGVVVVGGGL